MSSEPVEHKALEIALAELDECKKQLAAVTTQRDQVLQRGEAVIAELAAANQDKKDMEKTIKETVAFALKQKEQLAAMTSERDKLQYEIDMAANRSRETINHLAAQLAAVTNQLTQAKAGHWQASGAFVTTEGRCSNCESPLDNPEQKSRLEYQQEAFELSKQLAAVTAELATAKKCIEDDCENDTAVRNLCRPLIHPIECDGDSNGVPSLSDVVESALTALTSERDKARSALLGLFKLLDDGDLVRDITDDGNYSLFVSQGVKITKALAAAKQAVV